VLRGEGHAGTEYEKCTDDDHEHAETRNGGYTCTDETEQVLKTGNGKRALIDPKGRCVKGRKHSGEAGSDHEVFMRLQPQRDRVMGGGESSKYP